MLYADHDNCVNSMSLLMTELLVELVYWKRMILVEEKWEEEAEEVDHHGFLLEWWKLLNVDEVDDEAVD